MKIENNKNQFEQKYGKILREMKTRILESCPESDFLFKYYRNELNANERKSIERHMALCPDCLFILKRLENTEKAAEEKDSLKRWSEIERELDRSVYSFLDSMSVQTKQPEKRQGLVATIIKTLRQPFSDLMPKPIAIAGVSLLVIIVMIYSFAYFSRPAYLDTAQIQIESIGTMRDLQAIETDLQKGLHNMNQGNYSLAIMQFKSFISRSPENYTAHHYLGLAYLMDAEQSLPGLSFNFDDEKVQSGKQYLQKALQLSSDNIFYREENYWYLAKASLMEEDVDEASRYLNRILDLNRPGLMRKDQAKKLLSELNEKHK